MEEEIETLIEQRYVVEEAKHVIFGKNEDKGVLSGQTN